MGERIPVAVLASTGSVGQRFVQLLDGHPWFEVVALTGSERRVGQPFTEACCWILPEKIPSWAHGMQIVPTTTEAVDVPLVFSALPADIARDVEPLFAERGIIVCSNASAYRREADVPILLPEINPDHAALVEAQRRRRGWGGFIVTSPNCTSTGLTIALKPLQDSFGLRQVLVVSLQAVTGAGYPGVPSLDIIDNVIPFISGEEEKVEWEPRKMLGSLQGEAVAMADFKISAHTNRVAVSDGHLLCLSVALGEKARINEIASAFQNYKAPQVSRELPSSPDPVIHYCDEPDRPQPRLDRMVGSGMTTVIGRLRPDPVFDVKLVVLSHNTVRGAAGGSIFNAELLVQLGKIG